MSLQTVVIPAGVTDIEGGAFGYDKSLISADVPASVGSIGERAFFSTDCFKIGGMRLLLVAVKSPLPTKPRLKNRVTQRVSDVVVRL
jgi:hypothetical protein